VPHFPCAPREDRYARTAQGGVKQRSSFKKRNEIKGNIWYTQSTILQGRDLAGFELRHFV